MSRDIQKTRVGSYRIHLIPDSPYVGYPAFLYMNAAPVPKWVIECRSCLVNFTHSEVGEERAIIDYMHPTAPKFPLIGKELECPSCKAKALYHPRDLRYRLS